MIKEKDAFQVFELTKKSILKLEDEKLIDYLNNIKKEIKNKCEMGRFIYVTKIGRITDYFFKNLVKSLKDDKFDVSFYKEVEDIYCSFRKELIADEKNIVFKKGTSGLFSLIDDPNILIEVSWEDSDNSAYHLTWGKIKENNDKVFEKMMSAMEIDVKNAIDLGLFYCYIYIPEEFKNYSDYCFKSFEEFCKKNKYHLEKIEGRDYSYKLSWMFEEKGKLK